MSSRNLQHVLRAVSATPWSITPDKLQAIVAFLELRAGGMVVTMPKADAAGERRALDLRPLQPSEQGAMPKFVGVLPIQGVISQRQNMMEAASGAGTSTELLGMKLDAMLASTDVESIILDVDSPGGSLQGTPELAAKIAAARKVKPVYAIANGLAASAAYYLASAATELWCMPSGQVGSIGVFAVHFDESAAMEAEGVKATVVSAGKYKTEGLPFAPMTDEARASVQSTVDEYYAMMVKDIAAYRGETQASVRDGYGEGRTVTASQALKQGMIDKVGTLDELVAACTAPRPRAKRSGMALGLASRRAALFERS